MAASAGILEAADRLGDDLLGQPQHHLGKEDREYDGEQEHQIDRQRRAQGVGKPDADEFRRHQQHQAIGRRDQAERQGGDQHHAHVHGIDVPGLGQRIDQRHEDDDGRHRLDEIADDGEQQHQ